MQKLAESCEIDWYLQAELAYNKRFGAKYSIDETIKSKLDKKAVQKQCAKKKRFLQYRAYVRDNIFAVLD
ncbi:hypothetical protein CMT41_04000 [Colwellia sp. MT41]|nr:hypothetical protein CMT41_04000 [Colwellia sp. MT41]